MISSIEHIDLCLRETLQLYLVYLSLVCRTCDNRDWLCVGEHTHWFRHASAACFEFAVHHNDCHHAPLVFDDVMVGKPCTPWVLELGMHAAVDRVVQVGITRSRHSTQHEHRISRCSKPLATTVKPLFKHTHTCTYHHLSHHHPILEYYWACIRL